MKHRGGRLAWGALTLILLACAPAAQSESRAAPLDRNLLSTEELQTAPHADLYMVVQTLRPQWLRMRGTSSINLRESIKVYLDDSLLGEPESLRLISPRSVSLIRYLDGIEASQRWGLDHGMGAIIVYTRRE